MNSSGNTTRSAPCAAAATRASLPFSLLPTISPTVELSCATAMASVSTGRALIGKLYRLDIPSGNGVLASLICTKKNERALGAFERPPKQLLRCCSQSGAPTAERHGAGWLEIVAIKLKCLQISLDHALDHHRLIVLAESCTLAPVTNFSLSNFCEIGSLDRVNLQQTVILEGRVIFRSV